MRRTRDPARFAIVALVSAITVLSAGRAGAANYAVPDGNVYGPSGLVWAIAQASLSNNPGPHTISLAQGGRYTLTRVVDTTEGPNGLPPLANNEITIEGNGATVQRSALCCAPEFRIFLTRSQAGARLVNLTIKNGKTLPGRQGGGVYNYRGKLELLFSTIMENTGGLGGGVANRCGDLTVVNSTISHNTSFGMAGGGIANVAQVCGGSNVPSRTYLSFSTVFENRSGGVGANAGRGDGIANYHLSGPAGVFEVKNSIVASPRRGAGNDCFQTGANGRPIMSWGGNIAHDNSCIGSVTDLSSTNPMLGPLTYSSGPMTPVHIPLPGSPAVDRFMMLTNNPPWRCADISGNLAWSVLDQRFIGRTPGDNDFDCDIGAVEGSGPLMVSSIISFLASSVAHGSTATGQYDIAIGDVSGFDPFGNALWNDIVVANFGTWNVSILPGDTGFFPTTLVAAGSGPPTAPKGLGLGFVDGDIFADVIVADGPASSVVSLLKGAAFGNFLLELNLPAGTNGPDALALSDFNLDGKCDIAVANGNANSVSILRGNTAFPVVQTLSAGPDAADIAVGDLNGDWLPDLVVANAGGVLKTVSVFRNSGANFVLVATIPVSPFALSSIAIADFTGDGTGDLAVADTLGVYIFGGNGNPSPVFTLVYTATLGGGTSPSDMAVADFNGDSILDIATANNASSNIAVLRGTGNGLFASPTFIATSANPTAIATGRIDGDHRPDLAVAYNASMSVSVLTNATPWP